MAVCPKIRRWINVSNLLNTVAISAVIFAIAGMASGAKAVKRAAARVP
jgi:hypothetical protein